MLKLNVLRSKIFFLVILAFASRMLYAADDVAALPHIAPADQDVRLTNAEDEGALPIEDLRTFTQVFDQIRSVYVEEIDDPTLLKNAIIGMLTQLDPHSAYLDKEAFEELQTSTSGEFGGLGIEVGMENGFVKVISPIDDTPAQRAGIKAGDIVIKINGTSLTGATLDVAVEKMRGPKGSAITLTIVREGIDKPFDIKLTRDTIKVVSVRALSLDTGFAYVRIAQFQVNTAEDLKKGLEKLQAENKSKLKGVVLDLRNNPGGVLQASVDVADLFLEQGGIVSTKGRVANANLEYEATAGDMLSGAPMVVLINEGSASASEIVAGALQDQKRAIVMGTQSFGKGSVQTVIPLSEDRAIKLTTARYYTPGGRSIQAEGIVPDIIVEPALFEAMGADSSRIKEANLAGHLENNITQKNHTGSSVSEKRDSAGKQPGIKPAGNKDLVAWLQKDNQLHDALNVLKAIHLSQENPGSPTARKGGSE
jgi:carboxyl-terminal processing protease